MKKDPLGDVGDLRKRAEERLVAQHQRLSNLSEKDMEQLVHELRTHQIELEMQNEELKGAQGELENLMRRYTDLYEFAPIGYFMLDEKGVVHSANAAGARMLGVEKDRIIRMPFSRFVAKEDRDSFFAHLRTVFGSQMKQTAEVRLRGKGEAVLYAQFESIVSEDYGDKTSQCRTAVIDITERKKAEEEREITVEFLHIVNESRGMGDLLRAATSYFQQRSGFEAVGIRLREGHDYPYHETRGFPKEFVLAESSLCGRDKAGRPILDSIDNPALACMCGNIICGRFDPSKPFFTEKGSFWTNSTTALLATTTDTDLQGHTRNRCHGEGYESVGLFALRVGGESSGLLQLNDRRKGLFSPASVALWERLSDYLAVALSKFRTEEEVNRRSAVLKGINTVFKETLTCATEEELARVCLRVAEEITGSKFGFIGEIGPDGLLLETATSDRICALYDKTGHRRPLGDFKLRGIYGRVLLDRMSFFTNDPASHPDSIGIPEGHPPLTAFLGVPLMHGDGTIGMIAVANRDGGYREEELESLESLVPSIVEAFHRRRAEEELRQSEERYRTLFNTMMEGFCIIEVIFDSDGQPVDYRFLEINAAFEAQTGLQNAQGRLMSELAPDHEAHWFEIYGKIALTGEPARFVNEARALNRWYDVFAYRVGRPEKRQVAIVFNDITVHKRAEEALRESEKRLRRFYESGLIGVIYWNMNGEITDANDKFLEIVGYDRPDLEAGRVNWNRMTPPEYRHLDGLSIAELKATGVNKEPYEKEYFRKDGTRVPIIVAGAMLDEANFNGVAFVLDITEHKRAEDELRKNQNLLNEMGKIAKVGGWEFDMETLELQWTEEVYRIHEVELSYKPTVSEAIDFYAPHSRPVIAHAVQRALEFGESWDLELEIVTAKGNHRWVQAIGRADRELKIVNGTFQDITDRKGAEEALRESEGRHRLLVETMLQGVVRQDVNGEIIEMNPAAERILGKSREQFLHGSSVEEEHNTVRENGERFPWREHPSMVALQTGLAVHGVIMGVFNPKLCDYRWLSIDAVPVFRPGETRPSEVYAVFEDITERKKAEEVQGRLAAIVESAEDAIIGKDLNGIIHSWNVGAETIFGYKAEEVIGKPISLLIPPGHTDEVPGILEKIRRGEHSETFETVRMRKDGTIIPVSLTFSAVKDRAGRIIGASKIAHDISERKKYEQEVLMLSEDMAARNVELEEANKELEGFSYSVSHDLRAPLRHMTGFAELLERRAKSQLDETSLHYVTVISQAARKMGILIDDLLAFSRIGRTEIRMNRVSLTALVREVVLEMHAEVEGRDIVWKIGELPSVYGDPSMLKLVVANLISNAVKFTRTCPRAEIEIGCREERNEFVFFVEDNGVGFDMKYGEKLFGVFQRLHPQGEFEGTGIGLANVRRIISRHCGRTWADGSPGEGATFYFTLPKIKET
jgi:PAS domain S-box-containing protein